MRVSNVIFNNLTMKTDKGIECTEAQGISFNNVYLEPADTKPLVHIQNSADISFNQLRYAPNPVMIMSINGDRNGKIKVTGGDAASFKNKTEFRYGANASLLELK